MRKIVLLLVIALLLSSCQPSGNPTNPTIDSTSEPTTAEPTLAPTKEPTQEPTQAPTQQPTIYEGNVDEFELARRYTGFRHGYHVFVFTGTLPESVDLDISILQEGALYAYEISSKTVATIVDAVYRYSVNAMYFEVFWCTLDHVYYVPDSDHTKIYRTDYFGKNRTLVYEAVGVQYYGGDIKSLTYFGYDPFGELYVVEDFGTVGVGIISRGLSERICSCSTVWFAYVKPDGLYMSPEGMWPDIPLLGQQPAPEPIIGPDTEPSPSSAEELYNASTWYRGVRSGYSIFVFNGALDYNIVLNPTTLEKGALYVYNKSEQTAVKIGGGVYHHVIGTRGVFLYWSTMDHVFYVLDSDRTKIYRADYNGENVTLVYDSGGGEIEYFEYYGHNPEGKLIVVEDFTKVWMGDVTTGKRELLMEQYFVWYVHYLPYSLPYTQIDQGPTLDWAGVISEDDTHDRGYIYHIDTKENWPKTWH